MFFKGEWKEVQSFLKKLLSKYWIYNTAFKLESNYFKSITILNSNKTNSENDEFRRSNVII